MRAALVIATGSLLTAVATAQEVRNWFGDPFFQVTADISNCPEPAGPRVTEAERREQSHRRAEKGTTCWLAKEPDCERNNAYSYDAEIAESIRSAVREREVFAGSSLWVTVQGRVVFVAGCAGPGLSETQIEEFMRAVPHVQQAIAAVSKGVTGKAPYRVFRSR